MSSRDGKVHGRTTSRRHALAGGAALAAGALIARSAAAAGAAPLHQPWDRILRATVSRAGWVDYARVSRQFGNDLKEYLRTLERSSAEFRHAASAQGVLVECR